VLLLAGVLIRCVDLGVEGSLLVESLSATTPQVRVILFLSSSPRLLQSYGAMYADLTTSFQVNKQTIITSL